MQPFFTIPIGVYLLLVYLPFRTNEFRSYSSLSLSFFFLFFNFRPLLLVVKKSILYNFASNPSPYAFNSAVQHTALLKLLPSLSVIHITSYLLSMDESEM